MQSKFPMRCALAALLALLGACGGGDGLPDARDIVSIHQNDPAASGLSALIAVSAEAPGANCPGGGSRIDAGLDLDRNGSLSASEVGSTQYVCSGIAGAAGSDGPNTLARMLDEPPGPHCASGGKAIQVGLDGNANGVLDASEISSTGYACNGLAGASGSSGSPGPTGTDGSDGMNTLLASADEPAGTSCPYGGQRFSTGLDRNVDGTLDAAEVDATSYLCHGAPGHSLGWITVTDATQTVHAQPDTGYLAASDAGAVVVQLPAQPSVGDVVRINGVGTGGWRIAQNDGQAIYTGPLGDVAGRRWTLRNAGVGNVQAVASSADGRTLATAHYNGSVYRSTDGGITWTPIRIGIEQPNAFDGASMVSSADGRKLVVASSYGLYSWTEGAPDWTRSFVDTPVLGIAASADGNTLVVLVMDGADTKVHVSFDGGASWNPGDSFGNIAPPAIACSSDCRTVVVAVDDRPLYRSLDYGSTWRPFGPSLHWRDVASSADGRRLVAAVYEDDVGAPGDIYTLAGSSVQWQPHGLASNVYTVASSADGQTLMALSDLIHTSVDGGATWTSRPFDVPGRLYVALSADGRRAVGGDGGGTFTSIASTTPGPAGSISGGQFDAITLQYVGNGMFNVLSHEGSLKTE